MNENGHEVDVLLIYPPYFRLMGESRVWYPLGVGYIASYLNHKGVSTRVYNSDVDLYNKENNISYKSKFYNSKAILSKENEYRKLIMAELKQVLMSVKPKIIGMTVLTENIPIANEMLQICRSLLPSTSLILGGPHALLSSDMSKEIVEWDYIVIGEGEETFYQLSQFILNKEHESDLQKIEGIIYKRNGKQIANKGVGICSDLSKLPFPKISDMCSLNENMENKFTKTMISTSRGCPYKCKFCYMNSYYPKIRYRTIDSIMNEIEYNINVNNLTKFYFIDDSFGVDRNFTNSLCNSIIQMPSDISWSCMTHEKLINEHRLKLMKDAGCTSIHLGIESGSDKILKLLGKKTTVREIEEKCKMINSFGIKLKAFFMVGLPTETEEDIKKSIELVQKIKPYEAILQIYVPYPKTELYQYIKNNICDIDDFYNWNGFYKAKINYNVLKDIHPHRFDLLLESFFDVVEDINEKNNIYD